MPSTSKTYFTQLLASAAVILIAILPTSLMASKASTTLIKFEAVNIGDRVDITWTSSSESNTGYYTIERSSDGIHFIEITRVAAGNIPTRADYLEIDKDPLPGISIYRLKHTDLNGEYDYSSEVVVKRRDCSGYLDLTSSNNAKVLQENEIPLLFGFSAFGSEETLVVVRDKQGNEFYSKVILMNDSGKIVAFDPEGKMTAGEYTIIASANDQLYSFKVTVK